MRSRKDIRRATKVTRQNGTLLRLNYEIVVIHTTRPQNATPLATALCEGRCFDAPTVAWRLILRSDFRLRRLDLRLQIQIVARKFERLLQLLRRFRRLASSDVGHGEVIVNIRRI